MDRSPPTPENFAPQSGLFDRAPTASRRATSPQSGEQGFDVRAFRQTAASARAGLEAAADVSAELPAVVSATPPARRYGASYVAMWAGLGLISAGYLGAVGLSRSGDFDAVLAPVTQTLDQLAKDVADLKQTTASIDARERETAGRVKASESRLDTFAQMAANLPQAAAASPSAQGQRPTNRAVLAEMASTAPQPSLQSPPAAITAKVPGLAVVQAPQRQAANAQLPVVGPAGAAAELPPLKPVPPKPFVAIPAAIPGATAQIQTGSLSPNPGRTAGLLVASGPSLDSIRLSWNVLSQTHGQVLGKLDPRIVPAGDGSAFQLIAGPFANDAEALKTCAALKARGVGCRAAEYTGAPL